MKLSDLLKSNFTRIAENTTKYYLELTRFNGDRFPSEAALLATAGVLDAHEYVFIEGSISLETIIDMARRAVEIGDDASTSHLKTISDRFVSLMVRQGRSLAYTLSHLPKGVDEFERDPLFNVVFDLEVAIFTAESPRLPLVQVQEACFSKATSMSKAIQNTRSRYKGDALFASATANFMDSTEPNLWTIREQLGIRG